MGVRSDLAAGIRLEVAAGVTVYDHPADVVAVPAVVIDADDPYIAPVTVGSGGRAWLWSFRVHLVVSRGDMAAGFDTLEQLRNAVTAATVKLSGARVGPMTAPDTIPVAEQPTLQSDLAVEVTTQQTS